MKRDVRWTTRSVNTINMKQAKTARSQNRQAIPKRQMHSHFEIGKRRTKGEGGEGTRIVGGRGVLFGGVRFNAVEDRGGEVRGVVLREGTIGKGKIWGRTVDDLKKLWSI